MKRRPVDPYRFTVKLIWWAAIIGLTYAFARTWYGFYEHDVEFQEKYERGFDAYKNYLPTEKGGTGR